MCSLMMWLQIKVLGGEAAQPQDKGLLRFGSKEEADPTFQVFLC